MNDEKIDDPIRLEQLETAIGHRFSDRALLELALTHPSFAHEHYQETARHNPEGDHLQHYERLEFLGDAVLGLVVADLLLARYPQAKEGELSRVRAGLVCADRLAELARKHRLGQALRLGKGERSTGGEDKPSILADAFEALIAAVYLDAGFERVRAVARAMFQELIDSVPLLDLLGDFKTPLQEEIQARLKTTPHYRVVATDGPDHDKLFEVEVYVDGRCWGRGRGRSKKEAEQQAAREALRDGPEKLK